MVNEINNIAHKKDLIKFISHLARDFVENSAEWENMTIPEFLLAMGSWIEEYSECPANDIEWDKIDYKTLAKIIYMGKIYE